jgi:hypothetical protein
MICFVWVAPAQRNSCVAKLVVFKHLEL